MDFREQMVFPTPPPWLRNLLVGLTAAYVLELVLRNDGLPTRALAWHALENQFAWYQPVTRFLVQGDSAFVVIFGLLALYFLLPGMYERVDQDLIRNGLMAGALGGTALPLVADLANLGPDGVLVQGWSSLIASILCLFGLFFPKQTLYLMFVLPVSGKMVMGFTVAIATAMFLAAPSMASAEPLGFCLGTLGWFYGYGPGARKRKLRRKAANLEAELKRFDVIEGGRGQDEENREWIH